jgi:hypothetical protein
MFFKTDAPAGANLYACTATNTWSVQGGITGTNCWADANSQVLKCQDPSGNVYTVVKTATIGTANQWVSYIGADGTPHTSQPTAAAVGAVADPGSNGVPYRGGSGTATVANADQLSGPFFCQDAGTSGAYACSLSPAITGYTTGTTYWFRANTANTGNATLNLNGLGPKTLVKQASQPLAANDIRAGQWVMATYDGTNLEMQSQPGNAVTSVNGRSGAVTAQTGDYTFPQIGGTASAAQLPATAVQTNQGNTITAGTQDFSQAAHTLPMKSGSTSAMPSTCSVGETYFAADAAAGANLYGCAAANVWSQQAGGGSGSGGGGGGSSSLTVKTSGTTVGSRNTINIIPGAGITPIVTDTGSQINIQIPIDTAVTDTRLNAASGADLLVAPASNSGTAYLGCPSGITSPLTYGMLVHLVPDHASAGGVATFNYCGTGASALVEADGATNLTSSDLVAGRQQDIWYDGTEWRLKVPASSGSAGSGAVNSGTAGQPAAYAATGTAVSGVTAQAFRSSAYANIDQVTLEGDTNYSIAVTNRAVATNASFTAARTWTLPAASAVNAGQFLCATDRQGAITSSNTLTIAPNGSDTINRTASGLVLGFAYESTCLMSDGISNWSPLEQPLTAGTGISLTSSALGVTVSSSGGAAATNGTSGQALTSNGAGGFGTPVTLGTAATANTGTSGSSVPLLNAANTWSAAQALGSSTATTQSADDGSTKLATTAYADRMRARAIGYSFASPTTSSLAYLTVPFGCTISAWNATVDTGTIAWGVWKAATGTAVPTAGNSIVAGAPPAIATGTAVHSTTLTGWTTAVAANDIFAFAVTAVSGPTIASLVLECDQ